MPAHVEGTTDMKQRLTKDQYDALIIRGARLRATELQDELKALLKQFPALRKVYSPEPATALARAIADLHEPAAPKTRHATSNRRPMTRKERQAVSERMTAYWAARRAAKAKKH